jgi:hypothetical protein
MKPVPEALPQPPASVPVTRGEAVALPRPARRAEPSPAVPRKGLSPKVHPRTHGRRSDIGGKADAGDAFATWLKTEKGLDPDQRFPAAQLGALSDEFKARPISGHRRRGTGGDNHRVNPEHLRK